MSDSAPPVVFLPGLLNDRAGWRPVVDLLGQVTAIQPTYPGEDSLPAIAEAVLAELPDAFDLAGHSMGGYLALEILKQAPERVSRLALVSTSARADTAEVRSGRLGLIDRASAGDFDAIADSMARFVIPKSTQRFGELRGAFADMARRIGADTFIRHTRAIAARTDSTELIREMSCPCVAIGAADDRITPIDGIEEIAELTPLGKAVRYETGGHHILWTRPQSIADALRRWRREDR